MDTLTPAPAEPLPPPRPTPSPAPRSSTAQAVLAVLAVIGALWWGQRFLIPVTAGLMLAVLVQPLTDLLVQWLRWRVLATVLTLTLVQAAIAAAGAGFGGQLVRVAERAPDMISMVAQQLSDRDPTAQSLLTRARDALQELDSAAQRLAGGKVTLRTTTRRPPQQANPANAAPPSPLTDGATVALRETAVSGSGALFRFASDLGIIFFVAFFALAGGPSLSQRFLDLWGEVPQAQARAEKVAGECARQIRLYAGVLLVTNTLIGLAVWLTFLATDLPDAAGWGATAALLHVVPYVGMVLLTLLGASESFIAHGTIGAALGVAGLVVLLSTLIGTVVTSWLQGRAARMSALAVFVGLVFWGAMWGLWGLFLGPALVVLLKVVAEHTRAGQRLARLLQG